jgi:hypothetical protein
MNKAEFSQLAREAKAIVALAFRNGPIEDVHAGKLCPTCTGKPEYSHITQNEMRMIMRNAVDHMYRLLSLTSAASLTPFTTQASDRGF